MASDNRIDIHHNDQTLCFYQGDLVKKYSISSAKAGMGEEKGSEKTPRGKHAIFCKIGKNLPENTVFVSRVPTGEIYSPALRMQYPKRDWILTRILWLNGLEVGKNCFGSSDTRSRFIYIHGTPDEEEMGQTGSHGCIRMKNTDLMELFDQVKIGTKVFID